MDDHADLVSGRDQAVEACQIGWIDLRPILAEGIVVDRVVVDGQHRHAALQADGEPEQSVPPPFRQSCDQSIRVGLGVPIHAKA